MSKNVWQHQYQAGSDDIDRDGNGTVEYKSFSSNIIRLARLSSETMSGFNASSKHYFSLNIVGVFYIPSFYTSKDGGCSTI